MEKKLRELNVAELRKVYRKIYDRKKHSKKEMIDRLLTPLQRQFLYNPKDPKRSFDVYIDKDPSDTIPISYKTLEDVKNTVKKLEKLYKTGKYPHKRIWQVAMIMKVRLGVILKNHPHVSKIKSRYALAEKYLKFLSQRTKLPEKDRRKTVFK